MVGKKGLIGLKTLGVLNTANTVFNKHFLTFVHMNRTCAAAVSNVPVCAEAVYFVCPKITRQSTWYFLSVHCRS